MFNTCRYIFSITVSVSMLTISYFPPLMTTIQYYCYGARETAKQGQFQRQKVIFPVHLVYNYRYKQILNANNNNNIVLLYTYFVDKCMYVCISTEKFRFCQEERVSLILIKQTSMNACGRLYIRLGSMIGDTFYFPF